MKKIIIVLVVVLTIAGCANMDSALQRESARAIGGGVLPEAVQLQNVDRSAMSVKWDAVTSEGAFNCSADDMLKRVLCVKR